jgi:hypothetical protein
VDRGDPADEPDTSQEEVQKRPPQRIVFFAGISDESIIISHFVMEKTTL